VAAGLADGRLDRPTRGVVCRVDGGGARSDRRRAAAAELLHRSLGGRRRRCSPGARQGDGGRRRPRSAPRHPHRDQGHDARGRAAHDARLVHARALGARRGRIRRLRPAARRCGVHRSHHEPGVRLVAGDGQPAVGHHSQPVGHHPHHRGVVRRRGRSGRQRLCAARRRDGHGRIGAHPGGVVRRRGGQAVPRPDPDGHVAGALRLDQPPWPARPVRRGRPPVRARLPGARRRRRVVDPRPARRRSRRSGRPRRPAHRVQRRSRLLRGRTVRGRRRRRGRRPAARRRRCRDRGRRRRRARGRGRMDAAVGRVHGHVLRTSPRRAPRADGPVGRRVDRFGAASDGRRPEGPRDRSHRSVAAAASRVRRSRGAVVSDDGGGTVARRPCGRP
jgi:hypothetical protein